MNTLTTEQRNLIIENILRGNHNDVITYDSIIESKALKTTLHSYTKNFEKTLSILSESKHYNNNLDAMSFAKAITIHCLKKLESKGNENARCLLNFENRTISIEDLTQEVLLYMYENSNLWSIADNEFICDNQEFFLSMFGVVSKYLYQNLQKHYKRAYILLDDKEVNPDSVKQLSLFVDYDYIENQDYLLSFLEVQQDIDRQWFYLRWQGVSNANISKRLDITTKKVRCIENRMRKAWANFIK